MEHLELNAVIGYAGKMERDRAIAHFSGVHTFDFVAGSVINGIILLKDNRSMVYALGSTIVKRDIVDPKNQQFLQVSNEICCLWFDPVLYVGFGLTPTLQHSN